jgi:predicted NAD/FAD-dependent oxidoreductase
MRVGVVGAGVAGLAAARTLAKEGVEVTVHEFEDFVGGRCRTLTLGPYTFDPGATSIVPRGHQVEKVILEELDTTDLVRIETPVFTHDGRRIFLGSGFTAPHRYCYKQGIQRFAELLAEGLNIELGIGVDEIEVPPDGGYSVLGATFEALVLAVPTPEVQRLLSKIRIDRPAFNTRYRPCIAIVAGYDRPFEANYHAIVAEESVHPLHWLSIENIKVPGRAPVGHTALVIQMGPKYSKWNMEHNDDHEILSDALIDVERILGPGFNQPVVSKVVRWEHSQPDSVSGFDSMNPKGTSLVIAGDGLEGGRIEHAYDSGVKAARLLLDS